MPVRISLYNALGKRVRVLVEEVCVAGRHREIWDGTDANGHEVAEGVYFCRMKAGEFKESRKMVLLK